MPDLHLRARARESRVSSANLVSPLLGGLGELAVGALVVPSRGVLGGGRTCDVEASVGNTGVDGSGLEDVGVGSDKDVRHHGTGAGSGNENPLGVSTVLVNGVLDHVDDGLAVTTAIVLQGCINAVRNVPILR